MKIIQSYWSKPSLQGSNTLIENRHNGGFSCKRTQLMTYALSCLKFRQFYDKVELYTDEHGYKLLIEELKLPYTKVHVCLDAMNHVPALLWAIPKIYTYSLQDEPFIHVDTDIFIWRKFDSEFESHPLVAQSQEEHEVYIKTLEFLQKTDAYIPEIIKNYDPVANGAFSINAGVFGGNDLEFIQYYCSQAMDFFNRNIDFLSKYEKAGGTNIIIEQYLFYRLATESNKPIKYLLDNVLPDYSNLSQFHMLPNYQSYIHLVGSAKSHKMADTMVPRHLRLEFPEHYFHIENLLNLEKDYDHSTFALEVEILSTQFYNTIEVLKYFKCLDNGELSLDLIQNSLENVYQLPLGTCIPFIKDLFEYEKSKYFLNANCEEIYTEEYVFESFVKTKEFFAENDKEEILKRKYKLASPNRILLLSHDVLEITNLPNWIENLKNLIFMTELGEYILLLTKEGENLIKSINIVESEQLLYYFSFDPISGNELVAFLAGEGASEETLEFYRNVAFDIITKALIYGGHIALHEVGDESLVNSADKNLISS